jgi:hypothetical protein
VLLVAAIPVDSDFTPAVARRTAFDVFRLPMGGMDMGPVDSHSIFVVDANGHVAWKRLAADTMHVSVDEVVGAVKAA